MSVRMRKTQCVEPGGVRTALVPTAVSWAASLASTWPQLETALVSRDREVEVGGLRKAEDFWFSLHSTRNSFSQGYCVSSCLNFVYFPHSEAYTKIEEECYGHSFLVLVFLFACFCKSLC